ncbi:MAG: hypothetical protein QNJ31_06260 [Candidatus Caenarcaniphilales bacterium]|nr:hypothetical protein [Candidatus Caenarcaniphilales bacterium]
MKIKKVESIFPRISYKVLRNKLPQREESFNIVSNKTALIAPLALNSRIFTNFLPMKCLFVLLPLSIAGLGIFFARDRGLERIGAGLRLGDDIQKLDFTSKQVLLENTIPELIDSSGQINFLVFRNLLREYSSDTSLDEKYRPLNNEQNNYLTNAKRIFNKLSGRNGLFADYSVSIMDQLLIEMISQESRNLLLNKENMPDELVTYLGLMLFPEILVLAENNFWNRQSLEKKINEVLEIFDSNLLKAEKLNLDQKALFFYIRGCLKLCNDNFQDAHESFQQGEKFDEVHQRFRKFKPLLEFTKRHSQKII